MEVPACSPSYSGGWGRQIAWAQEVKAAVSYNGASALQPGHQSKTLSQKEEKSEECGFHIGTFVGAHVV